MSMSDIERPSVADREILCPYCGYDLRGASMTGLCSECGRSFDRLELASTRIAWAQAQRIGQVAAFWRTVWSTTFGRRCLSHEINAAHDPGAARRFWVINSFFVWAIPAAVVIGAGFYFGGYEFLVRDHPMYELYLDLPLGRIWIDLWLPLIVAYTTWGVVPLCMLGVIMWATGSVTYMLHPGGASPGRQAAGVALGFYASGPLAWIVPAMAIAGIVLLLHWRNVINYGTIVVYGGIIVSFCGVVVFAAVLRWIINVVLLIRGMCESALSCVGWLAVLMLIWLGGATLIMVILPWTFGLMWLMVDSQLP